MFKEQLEKYQPVVYQALKNACETGRISSAYLFTGPKGTPKKETAVLLAQSIFCEKKEGLACEQCHTCQRVKDGSYADLVVLDGSENAVSKEMVDALQEQFSKTALEKNGQRVYIILNAENASVSAQNSMLKFLEEPGKGITAILTADNESRILPTIVSRCTVLPFLPMSHEDRFEAAVDAGIDKEDAYFLSYIASMSNMQAVNDSEEYKNAAGMLKQYLNIDGLHDEFLIDYEISWRSHSTDRDKAKKSDLMMLDMFFGLLSLWLHDVIRKEDHGPVWYHESVMHSSFSERDCAAMIVIVNEERDRVNKYNDLNLLMDQAFYRLEEYNHVSRL